MKPPPITLRYGNWHIRRRVPRRYRSIDPRDTFISRYTDSRSVAEQKTAQVGASTAEAWEDRPAGDVDDAEARFAAPWNLAEARGFA